MIALHLLADRPERVGRVALLEPRGRAAGSLAAEARRRPDRRPGLGLARRGAAQRIEGRPPQAIPDATDDVKRHLYEAPDGRFRLRFHRGAAVAGWSEMACPPYRSPTPATLPAAGRAAGGDRAARACEPRSRADLGDRLTTVEIDCGHMLYWDAFDETGRGAARLLGGAA